MKKLAFVVELAVFLKFIAKVHLRLVLFLVND